MLDRGVPLPDILSRRGHLLKTPRAAAEKRGIVKKKSKNLSSLPILVLMGFPVLFFIRESNLAWPAHTAAEQEDHLKGVQK